MSYLIFNQSYMDIPILRGNVFVKKDSQDHCILEVLLYTIYYLLLTCLIGFVDVLSKDVFDDLLVGFVYQAIVFLDI